MRDGFKIIDADRHVMEPRDLWEQRLPAPLNQQVRIGPDRWPAFYAQEVAVDTFEAWLAVASFMGHNLSKMCGTTG